MPEKKESLEDTRNPWGIIPHASNGQCFEARSFLRVYGRNPFAQEQLMRTLGGLYSTLRERVIPFPIDDTITREEYDEAKEGLRLVMGFLARAYPEWRDDMSEGEMSTDFFHEGDFRHEPWVVERIDSIIDGDA